MFAVCVFSAALKVPLAVTALLGVELNTVPSPVNVTEVTVRRDLEKLESDNPGKKYEELLDLAAPAITERIRTKQSLNMTHVQSRAEVDRNLPHLDLGEL